MKPFVKYWKSPLLKTQMRRSRRVTTTNKCIEQKIRMAEIQLKAAFEKESKLILSEFQKPDCFQTANCDAYVSEILSQHLDILFTNCIKAYIHLCLLHYFPSLKSEQNENHETRKFFIRLPRDEDLWKEIKEDIAQAIIFFYETKKGFADYAMQKRENNIETVKQIALHIMNGWWKLNNYCYQLQVKGKLLNITLAGRSQYTYVCENSDSSCETCASLDGQIFDVNEAENGKNLPPMHPNCRCSITAYPALTELPEVPEILQDTPIEYLWDVIEGAVQRVEGKIDDLAGNIGDILNYFFKEGLEDTYGTYTTITIDGIEYRINMASFESVVIMPDGTYLVPELVSKVDEQMLELMKERDSLPEGDPRIDAINIELKAIYTAADESERHVHYSKTYAFYYFGWDATDRLDEYMKNAASNYTNMHDRYWAENLANFYKLVRNSGEMDLKNQPEWQNSAFIYDGEIVSQDALGNINYGYFGKYCNFPDSVLIAAGGVAQLFAGHSKIEHIYAFLDDPRDTFRIMQGIEIYEEENQP